MATVLETLRAALGLDEKAGVLDVRKQIDEMLLQDMTPEEKAKLAALQMAQAKRAQTEEDMDEEDEAKKVAVAAGQQMSEIKRFLALDATAKPEEITAAVKYLAEHKGTEASVLLELKELRDQVHTLKPKAELAERLEKEAREKTRDLFFSEQIRAGKLAPADKGFYTEMWAKDEPAVRKFFDSRKRNSEVKLAEVGMDTSPPPADEDRDPRDVLSELAEKRSVEKSVAFVEALNQIKAERPELTEAVASLYGPTGLRHSPRR
jgi:hypothetical protein